MKAGLLAIVALSAAVSARPHGAHQQLHERDDVVVVETAYQTQVEYSTVTAPAAIVYVDQNGNPINEAAPAPAPAPTTTSAAAPVVNVNAVERPAGDAHGPPAYTEEHHTSAAPVETYSAPPAAPTSAASEPAQSSEAPAPSYSSPPASGGDGYGITYSPYNADHSCKSASQVKTDIDALPAGYSLIRLYGSDCSQVQNVLAAAKPHGYKLFLGIYDLGKVVSEVATIVSAVNGDWSSIDTISVGNENVNAAGDSAAQSAEVAAVGAAVASAKTALTLAGYKGPVVHVDTFIAIINNPGLCNIGDYVAANCHAFFDSGVSADGAGQFVLDQAQRVSNACGGKKTVITESGWPSQGSANGAAVPSLENQKTAVASLKSKFSNNLYLFTAYDDMWKTSGAGQFGAEQWWGIYGQCPSA